MAYTDIIDIRILIELKPIQSNILNISMDLNQLVNIHIIVCTSNQDLIVLTVKLIQYLHFFITFLQTSIVCYFFLTHFLSIMDISELVAYFVAILYEILQYQKIIIFTSHHTD